MAAIYDSIGKEYDTTRRADPGITSTLAELLPLRESGYYLDVACGTGNYTAALANRGGTWKAFDQSETMLGEARTKSKGVSWHKMDAMHIDLPSDTFDGVTCTLAIHHFPRISTPFREIARVLKVGTSFVLFTALPSQMRLYWLIEYFPEMMEKACRQMPDEDDIEAALFDAGLVTGEIRKFDIEPGLKDFFLYCGKQKPEMYLLKSVRDGISSFRTGLCSANELESGLTKLQADIDSGEINAVMSRFKHTGGDYVFWKASKMANS